ncbi:MAG: TonB-dependent receptor [Bacteroidales bacterium]|nr:TonB-dependent receptor [Candidatus Cryptobacteroides faecihippi]
MLLVPAALNAGNSGSEPERVEKLDSIVVSASRAGKKTPVTYTMVGKDELRSANPMNSLPMVLSLQPSVVTYNEGGTGLGNSAMTIRGSKGSQVNVTLNGITLNDSESQEVFWVNIPALTSLISSVQLQRGLGTSANGSGAFGASVNMSTASVSADPFATVDLSVGSWNTFGTTMAASTGLMDNGLYFNIAYSRDYTDGYIRNAWVKSQSLFGVLGWMNANNSLRLTYLMGDQHSGITWDGIDLDMYNTNRRYNDSGEYYDANGNVKYYDNESNNYQQHHIQLNYTHQFENGLTWTNTLNYTRGDGYDEYYKASKKFSKYMTKDYISKNLPDRGSEKSDFIIRKGMGNDYYVFNSDLRYVSDRLNLTGGINLSRYYGGHYGKMLWNSTLGDKFDYEAFNKGYSNWYFNDAVKQEANAFVRAEYQPVEWLTAFADLQYRGVGLRMDGPDDDFESIAYDSRWNFFNPRAGLTFAWAPEHKAYVSAALGHREPGRGDIKENVKGSDISPIKPEKMLDVELGYEYSTSKLSASANIYLMEYWDMLLETGRLSSSGYAIKENVPRGYRRGLELAAAWQAAPWLRFDGNATLSINEIADYTSYVQEIDEWWDELGTTQAFDYGKTKMLMSPSVIGMLQASVTPFKSFSNSLKTTTLSINGKYVGEQYLDNTARDGMKVPDYFVSNLSLSHEFKLRNGSIGLSAYVNNLTNTLYYASGWRWEYVYQGTRNMETGIGVYPQAVRNYMLKVSYKF